MVKKVIVFVMILFVSFAYSADSLAVSGRVVAMDGIGLDLVNITSQEGTSTLTNSSGYYTIKISTGETPIDDFDITPEHYENYKVKIYNLIGQKVFDEQYQNTPIKSFSWNGYDNSSNQLSSGIYFSILEINNKIAFRGKITIVGNQVLNKFPFVTFQSMKQVAALSKSSDMKQFLFNIDGDGFNNLIDYPVNVSNDGSDNYSAEDIKVNLLPFPDFTISPQIGNVETVFEFDASSSFDPDNDDDELQYKWDIGNDGTWDTDFSTTTVMSYQFPDTGEYFVKLLVKDIDGEELGMMRNLHVITNPAEKPTAILNITPATGTIETDFTFDISSSQHAGVNDNDLVARWDWNNDGVWDTDYSVVKNFTKQYDEVGKYFIKVEVKDINGQTDVDMDSLEVENVLPTAFFTMTPDSGTVETVFSFDASGSTDLEDDASELKVRWDFDNDCTFETEYSLTKTTTYQYSEPGEYTLKVEVLDTDGEYSRYFRTVKITEIENERPTPIFSINPMVDGTTETLFTFDASYCIDDRDSIIDLQVKWDFEGDDVWDTDFSTSKTTTHQYDTSGVYIVRMQVKDKNGAVAQLGVELTVGNYIETGTMTDIDGNTYKTVKIGEQWWMAENLQVIHYRNGDLIPASERWTLFDADSNLANYGRHYSWNAVDDFRRLAPESWHIPSNVEWEALKSFLGSKAGKKLKSEIEWKDDGNGTNEWGFNAYPGGRATYNSVYARNDFYYFSEQSVFWSANEVSDIDAYAYQIFHNWDDIYQTSTGARKSYGHSVRCIKGDYEPDTEDPVVVITNPSEGEDIKFNTVGTNIQVTATDNVGVLNVIFEIESGGVYSEIGQDTFDGDSEFNWLWDSRTVDNGNHTIRITASDIAGNSGSAQITININNTIIETGTVTDIDGNVYKTVKIGERWWMAENLKVTRYKNGEDISVNDFMAYGENESNVTTYGRLYNWDAVNDSRGLAPAGWHIPTDDEWEELASSNNTTRNGGRLKATTGWADDENGTDDWGFSALPGGYGIPEYGSSHQLGENAIFWTITEYPDGKAWDRTIVGSTNYLVKYYTAQSRGYSIRCIMDYDEPDNSNPDVYITSPLDGGEVQNIIDIEVFAVDNKEINRVVYELNVGGVYQSIGEDSEVENETDFSIQWNSRDVANGSHTIRTTAYDAAGNSDYTEVTFTVNNPVFETGTVTDIDGNIYITVRIGEQWWMAENLKTEHYRDGQGILFDKVYDNDDSNKDFYGLLYNWNDVNDVRGIAPNGWHVPSDEEWQTLITNLNTNVGTKLKSIYGWNSGGNGTDEFGFTGLPGGFIETDGNSTGLGQYASFWTATGNDVSSAWSTYLAYNNTEVNRGISNKWRCLSIRCVKDTE